MDYIFRGINKEIFEKFNKVSWVYGSYLKHLPLSSITKKNYQHLIIRDQFRDCGFPQNIESIEILPNSVGRSTNKIDKNNKVIFSLDEIKYNDITYIVKENEYGFYLLDKNKNELLFNANIQGQEIEIIGFDNNLTQ